ncbi:MAG: hypothetical protein ACRD1R_00655, partial [Acidobacteriota bacterium]
MKERRIVMKGFGEQYRRASKKEKGRVLEQVMEATGYCRRYAARCLRQQGRRIQLKPGVILQADLKAKAKR